MHAPANPAEPVRLWDFKARRREISLEQLEELHIRRTLDSTKSLTEAAEVLGIDQATLYRKRKKIGLE